MPLLLRIVGVAVVAATLAACSAGPDNRMYSVDDVRGFDPDVVGFDLGDAWEYSAGEVWDSNPLNENREADPAESLGFLAAIAVQGPDDSGSASADPVFYRSGSVSWATYVAFDYRVFPSPEAARAFRDAAVESARACSNGYQAGIRDIFIHAETLEVGEATLPGGYSTAVLTERGLTAGFWDDSESNQFYDAGRHYLYVQGNVLVSASFMLPTDRDVAEAAGGLISQFDSHLGPGDTG